MPHISLRITGTPYGRSKVRGDLAAPKRWTAAIVQATKSQPCVTGPCILKVTFVLPSDKYPSDLPYGSDLDNLLKRLLDALNQTVFCDAKGKDSCVIAIHAMKVKAPDPGSTGVILEILSLPEFAVLPA
jgi:Holliday junction resolvase RusA-like endonuclease